MKITNVYYIIEIMTHCQPSYDQQHVSIINLAYAARKPCSETKF